MLPKRQEGENRSVAMIGQTVIGQRGGKGGGPNGLRKITTQLDLERPGERAGILRYHVAKIELQICAPISYSALYRTRNDAGALMRRRRRRQETAEACAVHSPVPSNSDYWLGIGLLFLFWSVLMFACFFLCVPVLRPALGNASGSRAVAPTTIGVKAPIEILILT